MLLGKFLGVWSKLEELFLEIVLLRAGKFHFVCPKFLVSCKLESCIPVSCQDRNLEGVGDLVAFCAWYKKT